MNNKKINIVTIWGWKGSYWLLQSIKNNENYNISAIFPTSDNWGSAGIIRKEYGMPSPWDVRRWIAALSRNELAKELFEYRYDKESSVSGHNLWNLILTAMIDITGSFEKWIKQVAKMFKVKWRVLPVTLDVCDLWVEFENWSIMEWETDIDTKLDETYPPIKRAFLTPSNVKANSKAIRVISKADYIIISFWDLYTSIIPNFLVRWIRRAIRANKSAKVIYFCNLMTKPGETTDFEAIDFVNTIEKYLWEWVVDYFVVNNGYISEKIVEKYKELEKKKPVKIKHFDEFEGKDYKVIEADLLAEWTSVLKEYLVRHSYDKVSKVLKKIIEE